MKSKKSANESDAGKPYRMDWHDGKLVCVEVRSESAVDIGRVVSFVDGPTGELRIVFDKSKCDFALGVLEKILRPVAAYRETVFAYEGATNPLAVAPSSAGTTRAYYTVDEYAGLLRLDRKTVYDAVKRGELQAVKHGKTLRILVQEERSVVEPIAAYLARRDVTKNRQA